MFGLIDCNNFYASCEKAFNPSLRDRPVVVLSNNDACVVSRSKEAKLLGIQMAAPTYQVTDIIKQHHIVEFSSNYTLYGDMSARVMSMLTAFVPDIEVYSIDEAFLDFRGFELFNLQEYGKKIVRDITQGTGIPVSLGIAPTKTLAKVANRFAKKYAGYKSSCFIDNEEKRIKALKLTPIGDVWGVGRRLEKKLLKRDVHTAYDFTQLPQAWVRKHLTVTGERTWKELLGIPCIEMELIPPSRKQVCVSRQFGELIENLEDLRTAVTSYASICAQKLRAEKLYAVSLMTFIHTSRYQQTAPNYFNNLITPLPVPTNDTSEIVHYALLSLNKIYRKGYKLKKGGVIVTETTPADALQTNLFYHRDWEKKNRLMNVMDRWNKGFTHNQLTLATQVGSQKWKLKCDKLSNHYTTDLSQVITINCK